MPKYIDYLYEPSLHSRINSRPIENPQNTQKPPILLLGCSYVKGLFLDANETLGAKLADLTKRTVYNWGILGFGPSDTFVQLTSNKNLSSIRPPEYVIYVYMYNHSERLIKQQPLYFLRKANLIPNQNYSLFDRLYMVQLIKAKNWQKYYLALSIDEKFDYMKELFIAMHNIIKNKFPNSKFVILIYNETPRECYWCNSNNYNEYNYFVNTNRWNELEKEGIIVINTKELIHFIIDDPQYRISPQIDQTINWHPSKKAWDLIAPELVNRLALTNN